VNLLHLNVTQVRSAATCPRLFWFDTQATAARDDGRVVVSRIWRQGAEAAGGGALFHTAVERFNARARDSDEVLAALEGEREPEVLQQTLLRWFNASCIDLDALAKRPVSLRRGFIAAVQLYMEELARIAVHARAAGTTAKELHSQLFGDPRKRVDVTFHVGDEGVQVHVTGAIDYVYFDPRLGKHRIVDYKLTPATSPNSDLFQVITYALMHHHQHGTKPDVAVFYLHPTRNVCEKRWEDVLAERAKVYELIASMVAWRDHAQGRGGLVPPGDLAHCAGCKHERSGACVQKLGDKDQGAWDRRWKALEATRAPLAAAGPSTAEQSIVDDDPELEDDSAVVLRVESVEHVEPVAHGMLLGYAEDGSPVRMDPAVLRTHVSVVGAAGSGKTWMAKVIAEEALRAGIPVIAIDPQGDLVQMMEARSREDVPPELVAGWEDFHNRVEPRILTPGSSHGIRLCLDPVRLPDPSELAHIQNEALRREDEDGLLVAVAANLVSLCGRGGEEDQQRTFVYEVLRSLPRNAPVRLRDIAAGIAAPEDLGIEEPEMIIRKAERERLVRRLNAFVRGPAARLFTGGTRLDFAQLLKPSQPGRVPLNVVYLNALANDDEKHFFLAALATELYRFMITSLDASTGGVNLLFYVDEARDWIPAGGSKPPAKQPLIRLFTQGRKYGVGCLVCTQSPRSVDYNVFGNTSTKLVGRLEAAQDVERVVDWFTNEGGAPPWVAARKGAAKGSFVARWPEMPAELAGRAFRGRVLYTHHAGAWSPDRVERAVTARGLRESV
jgi:hypothetical protein